MNNRIPVITIDGPSGSGKGTISMRLAKHLKWHYLDSGALYRALALAAIQHKVSADDVAGVLNVLHIMQVRFVMDESGLEKKVILDGTEITGQIRTEPVSKMSSKISAIPEVRAALVERQQAFRKAPGLVTDGRDMGTVIFPDATLKIFLIASPEVRAERRFFQLKNKGFDANLAAIQQELIERDQRDSERATAPLKPAKDAIVVDSSHKCVDEVLTEIIDLVRDCQLIVE